MQGSGRATSVVGGRWCPKQALPGALGGTAGGTRGFASRALAKCGAEGVFPPPFLLLPRDQGSAQEGARGLILEEDHRAKPALAEAEVGGENPSAPAASSQHISASPRDVLGSPEQRGSPEPPGPAAPRPPAEVDGSRACSLRQPGCDSPGPARCSATPRAGICRAGFTHSSFPPRFSPAAQSGAQG